MIQLATFQKPNNMVTRCSALMFQMLYIGILTQALKPESKCIPACSHYQARIKLLFSRLIWYPFLLGVPLRFETYKATRSHHTHASGAGASLRTVSLSWYCLIEAFDLKAKYVIFRFSYLLCQNMIEHTRHPPNRTNKKLKFATLLPRDICVS